MYERIFFFKFYFGCNFAPVRQKKLHATNPAHSSLSPLVRLFLLLLSHFLPSAAYRKFRDPLQFSSFCNSIAVDSNRNVPSGKLISWRQEADADDDDRRIRVEKVLGLDRILGLSLSKIWQFGKQFFRKWGIWAIHFFHGHIFHHAAMLVKETEGT